MSTMRKGTVTDIISPNETPLRMEEKGKRANQESDDDDSMIYLHLYIFGILAEPHATPTDSINVNFFNIEAFLLSHAQRIMR